MALSATATAVGGTAVAQAAAPVAAQAAAPVAAQAAAPAAAASEPVVCLESGDGYLRARIEGAVDARIDWPNNGTHCEGEARERPAGVRLSFQRSPGGGGQDLLFVFGLTGVREGRPAREVGANLTLIVQGTDNIYGTLGDSRCTVDALTQRRLGPARAYRVEVRGFCTQPAHAVRGEGIVLVSTFEFAGRVNYDLAHDDAP